MAVKKHFICYHASMENHKLTAPKKRFNKQAFIKAAAEVTEIIEKEKACIQPNNL